MTQVYNRTFFDRQRTGSRRSAELVVPIIERLVRPRSVVDVGCGVGTWLAEWAMRGVRDILGIDGDYVDRESLAIIPECFTPKDLKAPLSLGRRFDLVMSVEVAEHLPPECADAFVHELVALSDCVLFSAAIPCQGGVGHLNEQWQSYWAMRFRDRGYHAIDCVRPHIWDNECAEWWYAQNMLLYANDAALSRSEGLRYEREIRSDRMLDVVHPQKYAMTLLEAKRAELTESAAPKAS